MLINTNPIFQVPNKRSYDVFSFLVILGGGGMGNISDKKKKDFFMIVVAAIGRHESLQSVKTFMKPPLQERHCQGSLEEPRKKLESSVHDFNQEQRK